VEGAVETTKQNEHVSGEQIGVVEGIGSLASPEISSHHQVSREPGKLAESYESAGAQTPHLQ
jgi:hypothetical protein